MSPKFLDDIECRALPEVVGTALHGKAECADDLRLHRQNLIDDKLLSRAVGIDDGANQVLGDVLEVGEELLGILGQAVPAVAEAGVVVVGSDARVQADSLDDIARVEALALGIGIELVEVRNPQRQICVGKELDGLGFGGACHQDFRPRVLGAFVQKTNEGLRGLAVGVLRDAGDDATGVEVVLERMALAQKLRGEDDLELGVFSAYILGVTNGDGGLNDYGDIGIKLLGEVEDALDARGVKIVRDVVVVSWRCYDDIVRVCVRLGGVRGRM